MTKQDKREVIIMVAIATILVIGLSPLCWENHTEPERPETTWQLDSVPDYHSLTYDISPRLADLIWEEASRAGIPPRTAFRLVEVESNFNPRAVSYAHAYGLAQVKLSTARIYDSDIDAVGILEERRNLRLGFRYLSDLRLRFGSWETALAAYNAGPTRHARSARTGEYSGHAYARRVLR